MLGLAGLARLAHFSIVSKVTHTSKSFSTVSKVTHTAKKFSTLSNVLRLGNLFKE